MKKIILIAMLALVYMTSLYAQTETQVRYSERSKTQQTFGINDGLINLMDFVVLREGRMIIELSHLQDYESIRNMDSILTLFKKDIAFYKDSLNARPEDNMRIDYVINPLYSFKKIRIKKYPADGNAFVNRDGEISKLKLEQDTICIIMQKSRQGIGSRIRPCSVPYSIQVMLVLDNYTDIDKLLAGKTLNKIVDTLEKASQIKRLQKDQYGSPVTILYNPYYTGKGSFQRVNWLLKTDNITGAYRHKTHYASLQANIGAGLVRNILTPTAEIGLQYNKYWGNNLHDRNIFKISASSYYFFDRNATGGYAVHDNWFVNGLIGSIYADNTPGWIGKECTFGAGYLVAEKGGYFKNSTFRVFTDIMLMKGLTLTPEIIVTDNLKQVFPGVGLKLF